jgi:hypothetical protein
MTRLEQISDKADDIIKQSHTIIGHKELVAMALWCDTNPDYFIQSLLSRIENLREALEMLVSEGTPRAAIALKADDEVSYG